MSDYWFGFTRNLLKESVISESTKGIIEIDRITADISSINNEDL